MTVSPESAPLPVVRAADLDASAAQLPWLVDALWARAGVGILGGAPKCCKSWLGLDLALSVASHTPCLDTFAVRDPGVALIYLAEDAAAVVKQRLLGLCAHRGIDLGAQPLHVITAPSLRLDLERDQRRLRDAMRALRPRLLVLDPFVRLHRVDENDAGQVAGLLGYLRALQRELDAAVLVVHHARKGPSSGHAPGQSLRGSGDLHAWGDSNLYLQRRREGLLLTIEHRAAASPEPIALTLETTAEGALLRVQSAAAVESPEADEAEPSSPQSLSDAVLGALRQSTTPVSRNDLRTVLRVRNERLGAVLGDLLAASRVARNGEGWVIAGVPVPAAP